MHTETAMSKFTRVREHLVYRNKYIELYDDEVLTPRGEPGTFTRFRYRENPPGAVIVPQLPDGRFLLLRIFRYAFDTVSLELPRGTGETDESAEDAGKRELLEETGLAASSVTHLGLLRPDTSIVETEVHVLLAAIASIETLSLDREEEGVASYALLTAQLFRECIISGEIRDGFTLGAYGLLAAHQLI